MSGPRSTGGTVAVNPFVPRWLARPFFALTVCAVTALGPAAALAATVDQIVELSKAGVSEAVILALIDRDKTVFTIEPEQIVTLQRDGLSERVILAMLKSGRQEGEEAARAAAASNAAMIAAAIGSAPEVAFVGHGPDVPNTAHSSNFSDPPTVGLLPVSVPYVAPYFTSSPRRAFTPFRQTTGARRVDAVTPILCVAHVTPAGSVSSLALITRCPEVMQRSPHR
ncbi:MAG: hypothetical protein HY047_10760 [Acidobacteria bacterium]|nr:hypothetical protein [Acidobacteriota bacterium]